MNERKFKWRGLVAPKSDEGPTSRLPQFSTQLAAPK